MTEDILVSVRGLHTLQDAGEDEIEVFSPGKYYFRGGKHYILYDELVEETGETIKNRITLKDGCIEVKKKGPVNTTMTFERGRKNTSWYSTPMGNMYAGLDVRDMQVTEQEDLLDIQVEYGLELNYEHVADCRIRIRVMAKDSGLFSLH